MHDQGQRDRLLAILSYHKLGDPPRGAWEPWNWVPQKMFSEQLSALRDDGWTFVGLDDALQGLSDPAAVPARSVLVTFDDGYRSLLELGRDVLSALGCPAVVFVPTAFVGGVNSFDEGVSEPLEPLCTWDELRELEAAGVSVQSHGLRHQHFSCIDGPTMQDELRISKRTLEDELARPVDMFAFPYGDGGRNPTLVAKALERCGYAAACLYGGGPIGLPATNRYRLARLAVGHGTDVVQGLASPSELR